MHKVSIVLVMALLSLALRVQAQDAPVVEIFTGYSLMQAGFPIATDPAAGNARRLLQGWHVSATINANRWFGFVVADFGGYFGSPTVTKIFKPANCVLCTGNVTAQLHGISPFFLGPQFSLRRDNLSVFVHPLIGAAHVNEDLISDVTPSAFIASTTRAYMLGGGVDVSLSRHFALRGEPDSLMTQFLGRRQHNFRFSPGIVFRFGS